MNIWKPLFQRIKNFIMMRSRDNKLNHFYSLCDIDSSVLDVGVSNNEHNDSVNLFLKNFRLDSDRYTGLAIESMKDIKNKYPGKKLVEYPGGKFPFAENEFDWIFSNAVIEHVGTREDQLFFLNEMLRVGKNVFFTTPNKWFPIESHTNVLFRHWFNDKFYKWCKKNRPYWSIKNLRLFSINNLHMIMESSQTKDYTIKKNRILGWTMTYTVVCSAGKRSTNKDSI